MARPQNNMSDMDMPKAQLTKESLKEALGIFRYILPYRYYFIGGLIFIGLSSANTMLFPAMTKMLIDSAHGDLKNAFFKSTDTIALAMIGLLTIQIVISYMRVYLLTYAGEHTIADMRMDIYKRLIAMPSYFFTQRHVGELSSRITADVAQIKDVITTGLAELLRGILTVIIGSCLLFWINVKMTLILLMIIPVLISAALLFSKYIRRISRQAQDQLADSGAVAQETLQGITNVKAYTNEWYEIGRYNQKIQNLVKLAVTNGKFMGAFVASMIFVVFGILVLVLHYGIGLMQNGHITFGELTEYLLFAGFVGMSMGSFADIYSNIQKVVGATQRVREILKDKIEDVSLINSDLQPEYKFTGNVSLQNISFRYPSRPDIEVLKDISIEATAGEQIAIVGPSGAGKSTLVALLLRLYEPAGGKILFDGRDAATIPVTQLRRQIALVPQDIMLFGGTIYDNIAYGRPGASLDDVQAAARKANAHDFIMTFPEGYDTLVGERGIKLSGGQRQRIAIARAILKDPVILLLDEATSSLDSESEALVQGALHNLMENRTSFVIAHRLSTIRNADQIIVVEDGRVKERGTHQELIAIEAGLYKNLNKLQLFEG